MKTAEITLWLCLFLTYFSIIEANQTGNHPPLFISLGCSCEPAHQLRWAGIRTYAYPFDWLLTTHSQGLISLLQDDFSYFLDSRYLSVSSTVFNAYYNIEFRHDLYGMDTTFEEYLPTIADKYQRRIERFRQLAHYPGKVYFIRGAYPPGYNQLDPMVAPESMIISYAQAAALKSTLDRYFPSLNFDLIIINYANIHSQNILGIKNVTEFKIGDRCTFPMVINILKNRT